MADDCVPPGEVPSGVMPEMESRRLDFEPSFVDKGTCLELEDEGVVGMYLPTTCGEDVVVGGGSDADEEYNDELTPLEESNNLTDGRCASPKNTNASSTSAAERIVITSPSSSSYCIFKSYSPYSAANFSCNSW